MPRKSCPFPCKFLLAAGLLTGILLPPADAEDGVIRIGEPELFEQRPLPAVSGSGALLFIGGFGDEVSGIMARLARTTPPLAATPGQRAYYWYALPAVEAEETPRRIEADIRAYLALNPQAPVILIGHSMGAATALRSLARFKAGEGRFYLLTLDPVDRGTRPERPACVRWWGNAYVTHSQSPRDFIPELGGRWNACAGADCNLRFDGRRPEMGGYYPIHDDAAGLLLCRPTGSKLSLHAALRRVLDAAAQEETPKAPSRRASQSESESSATSSQAITQPART